jgi:hypothetical protein
VGLHPRPKRSIDVAIKIIGDLSPNLQAAYLNHFHGAPSWDAPVVILFQALGAPIPYQGRTCTHRFCSTDTALQQRHYKAQERKQASRRAQSGLQAVVNNYPGDCNFHTALVSDVGTGSVPKSLKRIPIEKERT